MHNTFIDLTESEVNTLQDIIDNDEYDDEIFITVMGTQFPVPFSSKIEFDPEDERIHENSANVCTPAEAPLAIPLSADIELISQTEDDHIHENNANVCTVAEAPLPIPLSSDIEFNSQTVDERIHENSAIVCTPADCSAIEFDIEIEEEQIHEESTIEFSPPDKSMPVPFTSKMEYADFDQGSHVATATSFADIRSNMELVNDNNIGDIRNCDMQEDTITNASSQEETQSVLFSPPSLSADQPLLYGIFSQQNLFESLMNNSASTIETGGRTQLAPTFNQSDIAFYLNVMNQHFDGKCVFVGFIFISFMMNIWLLSFMMNICVIFQENGLFFFPESGISIKLGVIQLIMDWRQSSAASSILYDRKFVAILMSSIIGDSYVKAGKLDKKKINFIKGNLKSIFYILNC